MKFNTKDISASIVVFLVALPLCLGIAHASGVPVINGLIAGIVGGLVVGFVSGSHVSVSGPAAGLITLVESSLRDLSGGNPAATATQALQAFAMAVVIAGVLQMLLGLLKVGKLADFIPASVIKGMLAAIGLLLILKQVPHLVGWDADDFGDEGFIQHDGQTTFSEIMVAFNHLTPMAMFIGVMGLAIQFLWDTPALKKMGWLQLLPAPLLVVLLGVGVNAWAIQNNPALSITDHSHLVNIPQFLRSGDGQSLLTFPSIGSLGSMVVWVIAIKITLIASIESLLSIEASDKIDPHKRVSPPNRELIAQGLGNTVSGLFGGIPVTAVIVRSSANVNAGGMTKWSAILHGVWLTVAVLFFPHVLNLIPNAALAAVLIYVGYKLAKPSLIQSEWKKGRVSFMPFVITIVSILLSDLLIGILIGMAVAFYFIIRSNFHRSINLVDLDNNFMVRFQQQATFLNKSLLKTLLDRIPSNAQVIMDLTHCTFMDADILDVIDDFQVKAVERNILISYEFLNDAQKTKLLGDLNCNFISKIK
ncbi:MAG: SulP family inorganic anion transporter [Bacteroidia bacterium]|nr:SulP family inorganic anion transporter [Bacteroidia bacterium]